MKDNKRIVVDAAGTPLGRVASYAAKQALLGKEVFIVNCNKALLTGRKRMIIEEYKLARRRGGSSMKGPFFPKEPYRIMKRTVRGMLRYKRRRGFDAYKSVMCYNDVPSEFESSEKVTIAKKIQTKTITLEEVSKEI